MYNQFFTIKPRISEKNGGSKAVHLILKEINGTFGLIVQETIFKQINVVVKVFKSGKMISGN